MELIILALLGIGSFLYIAKKIYGSLNGTDSPCAGCSDKECPFSGGEYEFDLESNIEKERK
ncbi:MAG: hypothetical protein ACOCQE_02170 [Halanaerobium sp.]